MMVYRAFAGCIYLHYLKKTQDYDNSFGWEGMDAKELLAQLIALLGG
jgi:hypothetical protein